MAKITGESCELPAGGANPPECGATPSAPFGKVAQRVARPFNAEQAKEMPKHFLSGDALICASRPAAPHLIHSYSKGKPFDYWILGGLGPGWPPDQDEARRKR